MLETSICVPSIVDTSSVIPFYLFWAHAPSKTRCQFRAEPAPYPSTNPILDCLVLWKRPTMDSLRWNREKW